LSLSSKKKFQKNSKCGILLFRLKIISAAFGERGVMKNRIFGIALVLGLATVLGACEGGETPPGGSTTSPTGEPTDSATTPPAGGAATTPAGASTTPASTGTPKATGAATPKATKSP
jgi:hypothetical protein